MKTAEELISDITKWDGALHRETVVEIVNHAIKEAIEETVRRCAENAETKQGCSSHPDARIIEADPFYCKECWNEALVNVVDKQSILQVEHELKKELGLWK